MNKEKVIILKMPQVWFWIGVFGFLITFAFMNILVYNSYKANEIDLFEMFFFQGIFTLFSFLYIGIMLFFGLWKVEIHKEYFVYTNCFAKRKTYNYIDLKINKTKAWSKTYFYKDGKKVFVMPYYVKNGSILEKMIIKACKKEMLEDPIVFE